MQDVAIPNVKETFNLKMSSMQDYLNKKYSKKTKKKKVKEPMVRIIDSDDDAFGVEEKQAVTRPVVPRRRSPSLSPVRRGRSRSPSTSPDAGKRRRREPSFSPDRIGSEDPVKIDQLEEKSVPRMSDGSKAGLQNAKEMKKDLELERERKKKEIEMMDHSISGKNAKTVYRDKSGRKVDLAVYKAELAESQRKEEAEIEAQMKWGKGMKQNRDEASMADRIIEERDAPLAVYADDRDRNEELKSKDRWGDPMARLMPKKAEKETRPMYRGNPAPPNRFGILPV
jgi:pre-mRNA-splicing factor CWC26